MDKFNLALFIFIVTCVAKAKFNRTGLQKIIFKGYNRDAIPKRIATEAISVNLNLNLYSIHDVDEKNQKFSCRAALEIQWKDEFLTWSPEDFGGVNMITVPSENIWTPDIVLQDTFSPITDSVKIDGRVMVKYNGHITIWANDLFTVACKLSIKHFPFDKQICSLDFLPWASTSSIVQLVNSDKNWIPEDHFILEKGEWQLLNIRIMNKTTTFKAENWTHVIFILEIQRKPLFHIVNSLIPVFLISILDVMCFVLPSESGERVGLSISIFLTLTVFLSFVNSSLPESSDEVAVFTMFIGLQILGSALSVIMTNISLYFYFKSKRDAIPVLLWHFAKVCCIKSRDMEYPVDRPDVTWQLVSRALDKVCLVAAAISHPVLFLSMLVATYQ